MAEKVDKKAHISSPSLSNNEKKRKPTDADFRFSILIFGNKRTTPPYRRITLRYWAIMVGYL